MHPHMAVNWVGSLARLEARGTHTHRPTHSRTLIACILPILRQCLCLVAIVACLLAGRLSLEALQLTDTRTQLAHVQR